MNKATLLVLSLIVTLSFSSCDKIAVHGPVSEKIINLDAYTQIDVGSIINVTVTEGEPGAIIIETNESVFEHVETYVSNDVLYLRYRKGISFKVSPDINISVPANNLSTIKASGAADVKVAINNKVFNSSAVSMDLSGASSFEGAIDVNTIETLSLKLSGASEFKGSINVKTLTANLSGSSEVEVLGGGVETLTVDAGGASDFNGEKFTTAELSATLSGASDMYINITKSILKADLSGASDLVFRGKNITYGNDFDFTGAADIKRVDSF